MVMKRRPAAPRPALFAVAAALLLPVLSPRQLPALEASLDFDARLFDADGIFLSEKTRADLLGALAALAANFPGEARIDDDLRAKALALALRLDPLHPASRSAFRARARGTRPDPVVGVEDLASLSEPLWVAASELSARPLDPEGRRLAPYLIELSLLVDPDPPEERLVALGLAGSEKAVAWSPAVVLKQERVSTARAIALHREAAELAREAKRKPKTDVATTNPGGKAMPPDSAGAADSPDAAGSSVPAPRPGREVFDPVEASLFAILRVEGAESVLAAGRVSVTLRPATNAREREWFAEQASAGSPLPLLPSNEDLPLYEPLLPSALADERKWEWPRPGLGEVRFAPSGDLPGPRRLYTAKASLPTAVLIESIVSDRPPNDDYALVADLDPDTLEFRSGTDPVSLIDAGAATGKPYLLVPHTLLDPLVEHLQRTDELELLFRSELVGFADFDGMVARLLSSGEESLAAASETFKAIEAASSRMPLPSLARNEAARQRLESLLADFPDHLSARAMLEYASRPLTPELRLARIVSQLDAIVRPFAVLAQKPDPDDPAAAPPEIDFNALAAHVQTAKADFVRMRPEVPAEARGLLSSAENVAESAAGFLNLTNRSTSLGVQRLRDAQSAILAYELEREKF